MTLNLKNDKLPATLPTTLEAVHLLCPGRRHLDAHVIGTVSWAGSPCPLCFICTCTHTVHELKTAQGTAHWRCLTTHGDGTAQGTDTRELRPPHRHQQSSAQPFLPKHTSSDMCVSSRRSDRSVCGRAGQRSPTLGLHHEDTHALPSAELQDGQAGPMRALNVPGKPRERAMALPCRTDSDGGGTGTSGGPISGVWPL